MLRNLEKIIGGKELSSKDLEPEEKQQLYALMKRYGASQAFSYDRFFKEGFRVWELLGIDWIQTRFLREEGLTNEADYLAVMQLQKQVPVDWFWSLLSQHDGMKARFKRKMAQLGMISDVTVINRFSSSNWKPFERIGVWSIIDQITDTNLRHSFEKAYRCDDAADTDTTQRQAV
jgi:hypothetical protein